MNAEPDIMTKLVQFAKTDPRIRLMTLEGSRTNSNVPRDLLQDYDVAYFVTNRADFLEDNQWLRTFGTPLMMQKPEDMELFPPDLEIGFSYLVLFADGNKLDLTIFSLEEIDAYFRQSDGLMQVVFDKDARIEHKIVPSDRQYWIRKPSSREFDDCCNEYWMVSTYVMKGQLRGEFLFAVDHLNNIMRPNLLRMMSWAIGSARGFDFSFGKNYKYIREHLPPDDWTLLQSTYVVEGLNGLEHVTLGCHELFRKYSQAVAVQLGYVVPHYDDAVKAYNEAVMVRLADGKTS